MLRHAWVISIALGCVCAGIIIGDIYRSLTRSIIPKASPCFDVHTHSDVYSASVASLKEDSYGRHGLKHITLVGGHHHGVRDVEVRHAEDTSTAHQPCTAVAADLCTQHIHPNPPPRPRRGVLGAARYWGRRLPRHPRQPPAAPGTDSQQHAGHQAPRRSPGLYHWQPLGDHTGCADTQRRRGGLADIGGHETSTPRVCACRMGWSWSAADAIHLGRGMPSTPKGARRVVTYIYAVHFVNNTCCLANDIAALR